VTLAGLAWFVHFQNKAPSGVSSIPVSPASLRRPTVPENPESSPQIALIFDSSLHWEERIQAVRDLPEKLKPQTLERLFAFLEEPPPADENHWYLICNEVMEVLRKRNLVSDIYTPRCLSLVKSATAAPVIRDYAAQHLGQWISGIDPNAREQDPVQARLAFDELCSAASDPANGQLTLAGTILNTLADAVTNGSPSIQQERNATGRLALQILDAPEGLVSTFNRATAIQVAARMQVPELPERCRILASNPQAPADVRLSAIAALGLVGEAGDRTLLQSFVSDETFKFAAAAAVERVGQRHSRP
jgi:hypothetical protein